MSSDNKVKLEFQTIQSKDQKTKSPNKLVFKADLSNNKKDDQETDKDKLNAKLTKKEKKSKRRSRHEEDGRIFKCECGKSYLSDTALTNHRIVKHNYQSEKRGKGRPKKFETPMPFSTNCFNKYNEVFFTHPMRVKRQIKINTSEINIENKLVSETQNSQVKFTTDKFFRKESKNDKRFKEILENSLSKIDNPHVKIIAGKKFDNQEIAVVWLNSLFEPIFVKLSGSLLSNKKYNEYQLYKILLEKITVQEDQENPLIKNILLNYNKAESTPQLKNMSLDEYMVQYLCFIFEFTNFEYFHFSLLFFILYREFLNTCAPFYSRKSFNNANNNTTEFTSDINTTPQELPNYFDTFVADFLETSNFYEISEPDEILQIIQHFCYWLFDKGYTTLRISLINLNIPN